MDNPRAHDAAGHDEHLDVRKHVKAYMMVFAGLMALTVVTVGVAYFHLPTGLAIFVALCIATLKGSLVACYFMHLITERRLILITMAVTVFLFFGVLLGPVITELNEIGP